MLNRFGKLILISNIALYASTFAITSYADDVYSKDQPIVNTDCRDVTDYLQDLEFYIQKLNDVMDNLCAISSMKNCSSTAENQLLVKYRGDISNLATDIKKMMRDSLDQACNIAPPVHNKPLGKPLPKANLLQPDAATQDDNDATPDASTPAGAPPTPAAPVVKTPVTPGAPAAPAPDPQGAAPAKAIEDTE